MAAAGPTQDVSVDLPPPDHMVALPNVRELLWCKILDVAHIRRLLEHLILPDTTRTYFWGNSLLDQWDDAVFSMLLPTDQTNLPSLAQIREWRFARSSGMLRPGEKSETNVAFVWSILFTYGQFKARQMDTIAQTFPITQLRA